MKIYINNFRYSYFTPFTLCSWQITFFCLENIESTISGLGYKYQVIWYWEPGKEQKKEKEGKGIGKKTRIRKKNWINWIWFKVIIS